MIMKIMTLFDFFLQNCINFKLVFQHLVIRAEIMIHNRDEQTVDAATSEAFFFHQKIVIIFPPPSSRKFVQQILLSNRKVTYTHLFSCQFYREHFVFKFLTSKVLKYLLYGCCLDRHLLYVKQFSKCLTTYYRRFFVF